MDRESNSGLPIAITFDVDLAVALSRKVHDMCDNVPHDIGIHLAILVKDYSERKQ